MKGTLFEWSPSLFGLWEARHANLDNKKFKYYAKENDKIPLAILNFDLFEAVIDPVETDRL